MTPRTRTRRGKSVRPDNPPKKKNTHKWERHPEDWYVEPIRATQVLVAVERFLGGVWDPACGQGHIVTTLRNAGYDAVGTDIRDRCKSAPWFMGQRDFLQHDPPTAVGKTIFNIACNPPYFSAQGTEAFIRRALAIVPGKVCIFASLGFLASDDRAIIKDEKGGAAATGLFEQFRPHRVHVITPRVSCPPGTYLEAGNDAKGGGTDFIWYVWDNSSPNKADGAVMWPAQQMRASA